MWRKGRIIILILLVRIAYAQEHDDFGSCSPEQVKYEWEKLNHYELLGFPKNQSTKKTDTKAIRKAYRQQAQQFHPDKLKANETLTLDEINSRFSQIGRAYDVLNDDNTREAYNRFLKNCKRMRGRSASYSGRQQSYDTHDNNRYAHQERHSRTTPSSIQKEREMLIDPMTGIPILRETSYEKFYEENYYRISIQDYDSYNQPLYPFPQVVEEGPMYPPGGHGHHQHQQQQSPQPAPTTKTTDTLTEGDVLRDGQALFSNNQQYRAHVDNCQLVIETRQDDSPYHPEIKVVWRSPNEVPHVGGWRMEAECFLALEEGQLMVAGGTPDLHTGQIFWFSAEHDEESFGFAPSHTYKARLENDGKLVVYRVDRLDESQETCIYATGRLGCVRLGSKLQSMARFAREQLTNISERLDGDFEDQAALWWQQAKENFANLLDKLEVNNELEDSAKFWLQKAKDSLASVFYKLNVNRDLEDNARLWLQKSIMSIGRLNRARRRVEERLGHRSLRLVHDVEFWWQQRQHR